MVNCITKNIGHCNKAPHQSQLVATRINFIQKSMIGKMNLTILYLSMLQFTSSRSHLMFAIILGGCTLTFAVAQS